jgi:hypothetical protein
MPYHSTMIDKQTTSMTNTFHVSTRRGIIEFTSSLTWEEAVNELVKVAEEGNEFALSLLIRERKNEYMSDSQVSWVYKLAQDSLDAKMPKPEKITQDVSNILGSLVEANVQGIKRPALRLRSESGAKVNIKYMTKGNNAGGAWVTVNGDLMGKIDDQGQFDCYEKNAESKSNWMSWMAEVNADVHHAISQYGKETGSCGCCGRTLSDPISVRLGIGPICLDRYGLGALR